jgi:hypothetical protein
MKIRKFNESIQDEWTDERVKKVFHEYSNFATLINDYINFKTKQNVSVQDIWWESNDEDYLNVYYTINFGNDKIHERIDQMYMRQNAHFSKKEYFEEILPFINDPELYSASKTYNL